MGSEFVEYLWGWQVTNPEIIKSWVWDEVNDIYLEDRHGLGIDEFLESCNKVHVKINIQALLLVAAHKEFWQADTETLQKLSKEFAELVIKNGLPGSGHTRPDHPMFEALASRLDPEQANALKAVLLQAIRPQPNQEQTTPQTVSALKIAESSPEHENDADVGEEVQTKESSESASSPDYPVKWVIGAVLLVMIAGGLIGRFRKLS